MNGNCIVVSHSNIYGQFYTAAMNIAGLKAVQSPSLTDAISLISTNTSIKLLVLFCQNEDVAVQYKKYNNTLSSIPNHIVIVAEPPMTSYFKNSDANLIVHSMNLYNLMSIVKSFGIKVDDQVPDSTVSNFEFVLNKLKKGDISLPVNNDAAVYILSKLENEMLHFKDLAESVRIDPSIHAGLIKMANSAYFGGTTQIPSLEKAMIRLGMNNVKVFLINYINKALIKNKELIFIEQMKTVIDHALSVASLSYVIAEAKLPKEKEQMFSIGIVHNIGKIFLYATFSEMLKDKEIDDKTIEQYENLVKVNNIKIGVKLLSLWNFPEAIVAPIRYHKELTANKHFETTAILGIANAFVLNDIKNAGLPKAMQKLKLTKPEIDTLTIKAEEYQQEISAIFS